jgi:hypothetical protein
MGVLQDKFSNTEVGVDGTVGVSCGGVVFVGSGVGSSVGVFVNASGDRLFSIEGGASKHPEMTPANNIVRAIKKKME